MEDGGNEVIQKMFHDGEFLSCQKQFSCAEDTISVKIMVSSYLQRLNAYNPSTKFCNSV